MEDTNGFLWILLRIGITGSDVGKLVMDRIEIARFRAKASKPFCCPDFGPDRADMSDATCFLDRPMPYHKYSAQCRKLLQFPPLSLRPETSAQRSTYSQRRFLPTVAGQFSFTTKEEASIGNWKLQGGTDNEPKRWRIASSMPVRYDEHRLMITARVKVALAYGLRQATRAAGTSNISWDDLHKWLPTTDQARSEALNAGTGLGHRSDSSGAASSAPSITVVESKQPAVVVASGSVSATPKAPHSQERTSSEGRESGEETLLSILSGTCAQVWWALPQHKGSLIHLVADHDSAEIVTLCKRRLKSGTTTEQGLHTAAVRPNGWRPARRLQAETDVRKAIDALE